MNPGAEEQVPLLAIILGFVVLFVGGNLLQKKLRSRHLRNEGQISSARGNIPTIEERVAGNRAWASGAIRSKGRMLVGAIWLLAAVWNLTFGASFLKLLFSPSTQTAPLVMLGIFALCGLPLIGLAVYFTIRQVRFGESVCRIHGRAGILGQGISGNISTRSDIEALGDYSVLLQCIETYYVGTGKNRRSKSEIRWQGNQTVSSTGVRSSTGIPFSIEIPSYPPETGHQLSRGQITWQLTISAPVSGADYAAPFVVPVFKMN